MKVKRLVRPEPTTILTSDGYLYEWPEGGEAVDVLPHHRRLLLAAKGAKLVEVDVIDQPVVLPAVDVREPLTLTTVPPPEPTPDLDLSGAEVEPAEVALPAPLEMATVLPQDREPDPDLSDRAPACTCTSESPAPLQVVTVRYQELPNPALRPKVTHRWSEADRARLMTEA